jgi:chloramphenicol-sensitive protein RarD
MKGPGILHAVVAYLLWGLLPVYWKALQSISPLQILAHRIVWSFIILGFVLLVRREATAWVALLRQGRTVRLHCLAAYLLALNWLTYIHGVNTHRIVETSLGYYINPLFIVLLGVVVLRERLRPLHWLAVGLAFLGVGLMTLRLGRVPWIALVLAASFGLYGLAKKKARIAALPGLTLETGALVLPAIAGLAILWSQGTGALGRADASTQVLLVLGGLVTLAPLLLFAHAARTVPLSTLGLLQFLAPSVSLWIGVAIYGEPFDRTRQLSFGLIWLALAIYWLETWRGSGRGSPPPVRLGPASQTSGQPRPGISG